MFIEWLLHWGTKRREREYDHQFETKLGMLEAISVPLPLPKSVL